MVNYLYSEHWRNRCEAFHVVRIFRTGADREEYIATVKRKRGNEAGNLLYVTVAGVLKDRREGWMDFPYSPIDLERAQ